jgi:signal transduction histidine kinase
LGIGLLLIYFIYGLAFWAMGLAVLLESGREATQREARSLRWLASFGMAHGSHEWLEAYLKSAAQVGVWLPAWLGWLRIAVLAVSFGLLLAFALASLRKAPPPFRRRAIFGVAVVVSVLAVPCALGTIRTFSIVSWEASADVASRYVLAVPSAALTALAMWQRSRNEGSRRRSAIASNLRLAAVGFAIYAMSQMLVQPLPWFPANTLNQNSFVALVGVPVQALRAVTAVVIAAGLLRAMQAAEQDRQRLFVDANQARLAAMVQQDAMRRDLLRHVVRSQEEERSRIARELHDQVAQLLTAFSLELASLRSKLRRAETIEMVARLQQLSRQMSESLYQLVRDLRPPQLDGLGLIPALKALASRDHGTQDLDVNVRVSGASRQLDGLIDTALFRVAQEALTNVVRHAHTGHADLDLQYETDHVTLRIRDEGCGFDPAANFFPPRGWGLAGMRERVEGLGGHLELHSAPSLGTTVEAVIPLGTYRPEDLDHG